MNYREYCDQELMYLISENNEDALMWIYEKYKPYINKCSSYLYKRYKGLGIEYDDLYQEGMYGLSEAIKRYDYRDTNTFYTFAVLCIKREMRKLIIKYNAEKHTVLNASVCYDVPINESGLSYDNIIYDNNTLIEVMLIESLDKKDILDLKYNLKDKYSYVYELKINGFNNKEIALLLDLKYKDVDNYLMSLKKTIRQNVTKIGVEYY